MIFLSISFLNLEPWPIHWVQVSFLLSRWIQSPYPTVVSAVDLKAEILQTIPPICLRLKVNDWFRACVDLFKERGAFAPAKRRKEKIKWVKDCLTLSQLRGKLNIEQIQGSL